MPKKRKRTVGWTVPIRVGEVRIPVHGKTRKEAVRRANSFRKHHLKNIEAGFVDASGFHPIRGSKDYKPARAGEGSKGGKARAKRATKKARKGRQAIS